MSAGGGESSAPRPRPAQAQRRRRRPPLLHHPRSLRSFVCAAVVQTAAGVRVPLACLHQPTLRARRRLRSVELLLPRPRRSMRQSPDLASGSGSPQRFEAKTLPKRVPARRLRSALRLRKAKRRCKPPQRLDPSGGAARRGQQRLRRLLYRQRRLRELLQRRWPLQLRSKPLLARRLPPGPASRGLV